MVSLARRSNNRLMVQEAEALQLQRFGGDLLEFLVAEAAVDLCKTCHLGRSPVATLKVADAPRSKTSSFSVL
jgi:hypothetical protein